MDAYGLSDLLYTQIVRLIAVERKKFDAVCGDDRCMHPAFIHGDDGARICLASWCPCSRLDGADRTIPHDRARTANWLVANVP